MKRIGVLGPAGTFSHEVFSDNFENSEPVFLPTIRDVFEGVLKDLELGIVPIENSVSGNVGMVLDCLMDFKLNIIGEILHKVSHNLCGLSKDGIKEIYCHPQTYAQCEMFIRKNLMGVKVIETVSNTSSAEMARQEGSVAILPKIAAMLYSIPILKRDIQDNPDNITRFIVVSKEKCTLSSMDRTSISFYPNKDRPGLLYEITGCFSENKINMSKIESRPSKGKLGDYVFFIDIHGNYEDENVKTAFERLKKFGKLRIFGSYKRTY